jgi:hypothetical protein
MLVVARIARRPVHPVIGECSRRIDKNICVETDHNRSCISSRLNRGKASPQGKPFFMS